MIITLAGDQFRFLFGPEPKHLLVLALVAIDVLHSRLGFANAPQPRQGGSASAGEGGVDGG